MASEIKEFDFESCPFYKCAFDSHLDFYYDPGSVTPCIYSNATPVAMYMRCCRLSLPDALGHSKGAKFLIEGRIPPVKNLVEWS